ncbi:Phosphopantetheine attachment site [Chitinophaga sp. CF118]|uniref:SDR family NAD(P)-dependent oxidoreductase n=1 Tax=Chitinophaga sp. CF118 TaxID=1884367 RepID=UPI0008E7EA99|nr:SDR family NAD(P)-dependent oxidoreductase [Chitinophaga sp. CF118]SFE52026.1 Phosphopantetheine attachment site [Chitinophaga sp. CF118]
MKNINGNISTLKRHRYSASFSGEEFFLKDHQVKGRKVLPGVCYIEMARAAAALEMDLSEQEPVVMVFRQIVWASPIVASVDGVHVHTDLYMESSGSVRYEICSEDVIRSQGLVFLEEETAVPWIDIFQLQAGCSRQVSGEACYKVIAEGGLRLGAGFNGMIQIHEGEGYVLGCIEIPLSVRDTLDDYIMHPSMLDSALQSAAVLIGREQLQLRLPYAAEEVRVYGRCSTNMWAYARYSEGCAPLDVIQRLDVDLADEEGNVCVRIKGIVFMALDKEAAMVTPSLTPVREPLLETTDSIPDLQEKTIQYLKTNVGSAINLPVSQIDSDTAFERYGIDSILVMQLTNELQEEFGALPATLFFEYQSIKELSGYFLSFHEETLIRLFDVQPVALPAKPADKPRQPLATAATTGSMENGAAIKEIAIIGLSGRYPGAGNVNELWDNLKQGKDCITEIPKDRWDADKEYKEGRSKGKWGGFMQDVDKFDPSHFNLSPEVAEMLDPQIRLFMEIVWATFEDAGYAPRTRLDTRIGVYVGSMTHEYPLVATDKSISDELAFSTSWAIANRVSYHFGLSGPSVAVNTASSSSMTAIVQACDSIMKGDCSAAIAGGVNLSLHPSKWQSLAEYGYVGSTRTSKIFGNGDGYIPGEGVGAVLLKPLSKAVEDGDQIYGVIISNALNHNGGTSGFGVPNPKTQSLLMIDSLERSGVDPATISYIEAAANGSPIGDPIEIASLSRVFGEATGKQITIGSVKSNIGHLEAASGISQLTKVLLQLKYKQFVPGINLENLNENLHLERTPLKFCKALTEWRPNGTTRRAMINSFGAGGSNAHLVVEEYLSEHKEQYTSAAPAIIVLSARDAERLQEQVSNLKAYVESQPDIDLFDIAYTLQIGREPMEERLALIAKNREELIAQLSIYLDGKKDGLLTGNIRKDKIGFSIQGKAGEAYVKEAIKEKESDSLAQLWVQGISIDWNALYPANKPNKISLPTYPFARERYWIPRQERQAIKVLRTEPAEKTGEAERINTYLYSNNWQASVLTATFRQETTTAQLILLAGGSGILAEKLAVRLETTVEAIPQQTPEAYFIHVLGKVKEKQAVKTATQIIIVCRNTDYMNYGFIAGLLKTATRENPKLTGKIIGVDNLSLTELGSLTKILEAEQHIKETEVRYKDGIRAIRTVQELEVSSRQAEQITIKEGGVYLITGGAGGLGRIFAEHISKTQDTKLILTGRSVLGREAKDALAKIPNAEYHQCDVSNKEDVIALIQKIKRKYQKLDGIIHSAGVIRDSYILKKTAGEASEVLSAKIQGARNLDEATKEETLDFMVFFSSVAGVLGNPGQADYAAANAYLDEYAHYRNEEKAKGKRQGRTLSIAWPLWKDGGMRMALDTVKHLEKQWGMLPLTTGEGIRAFEELLNSTESQGIVVFGNQKTALIKAV